MFLKALLTTALTIIYSSSIVKDITDNFDLACHSQVYDPITLVNKVEHEYGTVTKLLYEDHQKISQFSKKMESYEVNPLGFEVLFWKGLQKSFDFHQSQGYIDQFRVNHIIEEKFLHNPILKHKLEKPFQNISKSDKSFDVLNTFSGQWHGKWLSMDVEHLWLPINKCDLNINHEYSLVGFQTCFTGDGFGWNYLIQKQGQIIILGHVYHFNKKGDLEFENPHYGFINEYNELTWISNNHIYHEYVCDNNCMQDKHYVIAAIPYYQWNKPMFGEIIQAVYLPGKRNP